MLMIVSAASSTKGFPLADVRYEHATCIYPGSEQPAVNDLSLEIEDGEFVVLVGPSGSGKTTALRMLAGLEEVTAGAVSIGGRDVTDETPKDRGVAMVFQNYALYPHLTVAANIGFPLKIARVKKNEREQRVREAAEMLGLSDYLERKPGQLSGGQRQRVAMGRAIVREAKVFLMDEPLSNLDAKLRVQMRADIAALQSRLGVTTVYVTHDQAEAMTLGNRVAVMNNSQLQQFDAPRVLYDKPVNTFVAGFIGSPAMNLVTVPVANGSVSLGGVPIPLPAAAQGLEKVIVGVRPESLELAPDGIAATVEVVEVIGADAFVFCALEDETKLVARSSSKTAPDRGASVSLRPIAADAHVFDPADGTRIG